MPKYTLSYFPSPGRAEIIRIMFAVAGVEFENVMLTWQEWPSVKKDQSRFPLRMMPVLDIDGLKITQAHAIYRYLAHEFNMYGKSNVERAAIDQIGETLSELFESAVSIMYVSQAPPAQKEELYKEFLAKEGTKVRIGFINNFLKNSTSGYLVGDGMTLADISFFARFDLITTGYPKALDEYPDLKALFERLGAHEKIKAHVAGRNYKY